MKIMHFKEGPNHRIVIVTVQVQLCMQLWGYNHLRGAAVWAPSHRDGGFGASLAVMGAENWWEGGSWDKAAHIKEENTCWSKNCPLNLCASAHLGTGTFPLQTQFG